MVRKSPYKHPVSGHYRDGKFIENYERGKGNKPTQPRGVKPRTRAGVEYNVVFSFPDGSTESYNTGGTATGALKSAVGMIQQPMIPKRATLTLIGGKTR